MTRPPFESTDVKVIQAQSNCPDQLTVVALAQRPGVMRFFVTLEHRHFPPRSSLNNLFHFFVMSWPENLNFFWMVAIVPVEKRPEVHQVAEEMGLVLRDGIPHIITVEGIQTFPLQHQRVVTVENDATSPLYVAGGVEFLQAEEKRWLDQWRQNGGRLPEGF